MISAYLKGKSGVIEDSITSSIFDTLLQLPDEIFWKLLRNSCYDNKNMPLYVGHVLDYEFWPHWGNEKTGNVKYVEPDLFIQFEEIDIIIEAKRENNIQNVEQWKKEIIAYTNEYGKSKATILIAIDGLLDEGSEILNIENNFSVTIFKTKWAKIYETSINFTKSIRPSSYINTNHYKRLFSNLINYLEYYGFSMNFWFNDLFEYNYSIKNLNESIHRIKLFLKLDNIEPENKWINSIEQLTKIKYNKNINLVKKIGGKNHG